MPSILVVSSETPDQQDERRARSGAASHETYIQTLQVLAPDCDFAPVCCVDATPLPGVDGLRVHDGVVWAGSPIQMHRQNAQTEAAARFMADVFASGVPAFGSCAGLQIAAVAAGGSVCPFDGAMQAGFARGITRSAAGRSHFLLAGRPNVWDAPAMHSSRVDRMPEGGRILAASDATPVEAAEIRHGAGVFWGVQYHPELALTEIAQALEGQSDALIAQGLLQDEADIRRYGAALATLEDDPSRRDLGWQLGLDAQVIALSSRRREIVNFLDRIGVHVTVRAS